MRKQYRQILMYGTKHIKKHLLDPGRNSECKQPHELSVKYIRKIWWKGFFGGFPVDFLKYYKAEWLILSR